MEQLVVNNRKLAVTDIEGTNEYKRLVQLLMIEEYDVHYNYSVAVYESRNDLKEYMKRGLNHEFEYLPKAARLVEQRRQEILALGYNVPNIKGIVLKEIEKNLRKEYGEDAKIEAIPYKGITSTRMKEVEDIFTNQVIFVSVLLEMRTKKYLK